MVALPLGDAYACIAVPAARSAVRRRRCHAQERLAMGPLTSRTVAAVAAVAAAATALLPPLAGWRQAAAWAPVILAAAGRSRGPSSQRL
eukprot:365453-Chlamydomonas_euryale.AAC.9